MFQQKIDYIKGIVRRKNQGESFNDVVKMTEYKLSQLLGELREKSPNDTDGQKVLRDLIDFQYQQSQQIFHFAFYIYIVLFTMPMIFQ